MSAKTKGFTIVELVVVIVIIAILAAITVVGYSSIQRQARNTAIIHNTQAWIRMLNTMYVKEGIIEVDISAEERSICLGTKAQYPAIAGLDEGQCHWRAYTSDQLEAVISRIGNISMTVDTIDGFRGLQYGYDYETGVTNNKTHALLWFVLHGEGQNCGAVSGGTVSRYEESGDGYASCFVNIKQEMGVNPIILVVDGTPWI